MPNNLSTILKTLMNEVKITVTELARQTGVGQPVIHRMASGETDNPKVGSLSPIAKFFNVTISQLVGDDALDEDRLPGSHNPFYRKWTKLPLLSWEQAAVWPHSRIPSEVSSFVSTESIVSNTAFAIRMEDTTMSPRFPEGTLLIIEPTITPRDHDYACVLIPGESRIQFKEIMFDGDELYLKPFNKDFEVKRIGKDFKLLGVLVQAVTEFYQDRLPPQESEAVSAKPPVKKRKEKAMIEDED